jgi:hypothetical protein
MSDILDNTLPPSSGFLRVIEGDIVSKTSVLIRTTWYKVPYHHENIPVVLFDPTQQSK